MTRKKKFVVVDFFTITKLKFEKVFKSKVVETFLNEICSKMTELYHQNLEKIQDSFKIIKDYYDQKHGNQEKFQSSCDLILKSFECFGKKIETICKNVNI
jgi:aspartyl/asparaginyl-tRNA synthetase